MTHANANDSASDLKSQDSCGLTSVVVYEDKGDN